MERRRLIPRRPQRFGREGSVRRGADALRRGVSLYRGAHRRSRADAKRDRPGDRWRTRLARRRLAGPALHRSPAWLAGGCELAELLSVSPHPAGRGASGQRHQRTTRASHAVASRAECAELPARRLRHGFPRGRGQSRRLSRCLPRRMPTDAATRSNTPSRGRCSTRRATHRNPETRWRCPGRPTGATRAGGCGAVNSWNSATPRSRSASTPGNAPPRGVGRSTAKHKAADSNETALKSQTVLEFLPSPQAAPAGFLAGSDRGNALRLWRTTAVTQTRPIACGSMVSPSPCIARTPGTRLRAVLWRSLLVLLLRHGGTGPGRGLDDEIAGQAGRCCRSRAGSWRRSRARTP